MRELSVYIELKGIQTLVGKIAGFLKNSDFLFNLI